MAFNHVAWKVILLYFWLAWLFSDCMVREKNQRWAVFYSFVMETSDAFHLAKNVGSCSWNANGTRRSNGTILWNKRLTLGGTPVFRLKRNYPYLYNISISILMLSSFGDLRHRCASRKLLIYRWGCKFETVEVWKRKRKKIKILSIWHGKYPEEPIGHFV